MIKEKLEKRITFRVTEKENEQLIKVAQQLGVRPSDAMRLALGSVTRAAKELQKQA